jgi:glutamate/tyrosine decarboxylase-like PLP-dependent enzyme
MSIIVRQKTVITLSEFLSAHGLTLLVRETGASTWEASFDPEVLEETGEEDEEGEEVVAPVMTVGESTIDAIRMVCDVLSGHENLCIDEDAPLDLDLHYTKVVCDQE